MTKTMTTGKAALALAAAALASAAVFGLAAQPAQAAAVKAPKVSSVTVSGDVDKATVTVKVKGVKVKSGKSGAQVKITLPSGKTKTASVTKSKKATFKKVKVGEAAKVKAKARAWAKKSGKKKYSKWSKAKISKATGVRAPGAVSLSNACAPDTAHAQVALSKASLATSYQVQVSLTSGFKQVKTTTSSKAGAVKAAGYEGQASNHVRARAVRTVNGKSAYSAWSMAVVCNLSAHTHDYSEVVKEHHKAQVKEYYTCIDCGYTTDDRTKIEDHYLKCKGVNISWYSDCRAIYVTIPPYDSEFVICSVCRMSKSASCSHSGERELYGYASSAEKQYKAGEAGFEGVDYKIFSLPMIDSQQIQVGTMCPDCGAVTVLHELNVPDDWWVSTVPDI